MLSEYRALPGAFDELLGATDKLRATVEAMVTSGSAEQFARAQALAERRSSTRASPSRSTRTTAARRRSSRSASLPRVISAADWDQLERGLEQRVLALERLPRRRLRRAAHPRGAAIPAEVVLGAKQLPAGAPRRPAAAAGAHPRLWHRSDPRWRRASSGCWKTTSARPPASRTCWRTGCSPSGSSPEVVRGGAGPAGEPLSGAAGRRAAQRLSRRRRTRPTVVVLTPGPYNSAYFEHSFLARRWAWSWCRRADLFVDDDRLFLHTIRGPRRVHVVYRRTDDAFLDPEVFRPDSCSACRGLMRVWARGNVALANAPGNGVADDKGVYPFVPEMVRFYLGEEPLLAQVPTYQCARATTGATCSSTSQLVVKAVDEAGGYGMLMGPHVDVPRSARSSAAASSPSRAATSPSPASSSRPARPGISQAACIVPAAGGPPALTSSRPRRPLGAPRRPDPGGAARGQLRGQQQPGWRHARTPGC